MKYTRVAAIIAGSVAALGAASPAMAATTSGMPPMSLNGGVNQLVSQSPLLNGGSGNVVKDVADTAMELNQVKGDAPQSALKTAGAATPLLGGIELGG
ncbi:hypothetical protein GCM10010387_08220 [Streptomyces inusitatus]|uniref:Secreted protein n=1 Tax=Streptomyces inusitatus TaxID=68221 RepID=A0A918PQJ9_9ACTN|nr:hypothetical protein [Streptomyces inusitatus]GGZ18142.1 hypothetical protein GCM10010387_08220 [Streptomyces inusitatus]